MARRTRRSRPSAPPPTGSAPTSRSTPSAPRRPGSSRSSCCDPAGRRSTSASPPTTRRSASTTSCAASSPSRAPTPTRWTTSSRRSNGWSAARPRSASSPQVRPLDDGPDAFAALAGGPPPAAGQGLPRRRGPRDVSALDGKVALVAGASTGIGLATALAFADAGAQAHAAARRPELIEEGAGDRVVAHALDVGDRDAVAELARAIGPLHALVVAAGTNIKRRRFEETSDEDWDRVLATNLTGAFNVDARVPAGAARDARRRGPDRQRVGQLHRPLRRRLPGVQGRPARARARRGVRRRRAGSASPRSRPAWSTRRSSTNRLAEIPDARACAPRCCRPEDVAAASPCSAASRCAPRATSPELTILPTALQAMDAARRPAPDS